MLKRKCKIEELTKVVDDYEKKFATTEQKIEEANKDRKDTNEREELLQALTQRENTCKEMEQELERYRECDPEVLEDLKKATGMAREAATRWTDNVFSVKHWCKSKFNVDEKDIDKAFGIPEDFDYIDL